MSLSSQASDQTKATRIASAQELGVTDDDLAQFYKTHWARPIALSQPDFINWQMRQAPASLGENHAIVALAGDEIIAAMGANPAPFLHQGKSTNAAELTTWIVAPQTRGTGIGKRILAFLQDRYSVLLGGGISQAALPLYLDAGFSFTAHIPRFFYVADFAGLGQFAQAKPSALRLTARRQDAATPVAFNAIACTSADLAAQGQVFHATGLARNRARLNWRFDQHPVFPYESHLVTDHDAPGAGAGVVLRFDKIAGATICHLVDIFGDRADFPAALSFVEAQTRDRNAVFVDFSGTYGPLLGLLRARGWSSAVDDPLIELPSLFHPVELRRPPTTSLAIWANTGRDTLYDFSALHITKADLDFDRPTLAYLEGHAC